VRVPSDRQLIYNDKRANPKGKMPDDVWTEFSRVCGTFNERQRWHPCQMPESLLKRIIAASSNPGQLVLDPFGGSGTTASAAVQLGRDYLGIDISEQYVKNARLRLKKSYSKKNDLFLASAELAEVKRLLSDMAVSSKQVLRDNNLLEVFANQLNVRMSGQELRQAQSNRRISQEKISAVLGVLAD